MTDSFDPSALFGGGADGANPMAGLLAQAQEMQATLMRAQQELDAAVVVGSAGNGLVKITGTGGGEVTGVEISPDVVDPSDVETLQDLVVGALTDFSTRREVLMNEKMGPMAGGLPGLG